MKIKEYKEIDLILLCNDILFKTLVELGQKKPDDWLQVMSNSLANDLMQDFPNMEDKDIVASFRQGVRNTDKFVLNVQTYYTWIKDHRQLIWNEESKEPHRRDKRLQYRTREGTGLKLMSNQIKKIQ